MQIWNYEAGSGALIGPGMADPCPIEAGCFLVPANATTIAPPEFDAETEVCTFVDGEWTVATHPGQQMAAKPSLDTMAAEAALQAQAVCTDILRQIYPDPIRQAALQSAAAIVNGNGGKPPTSGPTARKLEDLARLYIKGDDAKETFCAIVVCLQHAAIDLNIALAMAETTIAAAKKAGQIKSAIEAFQSAIGTIVKGINESRLPAPVVAAGPILISGINA